MPPAPNAPLATWLSYLEALHPTVIDLGLERIRAVARRLDIDLAQAVVITVGGTNGKGSTCALLDAILRAAGYRTGVYTSPHLITFNERICIDGKMADDAGIVAALARIEAVRGAITLSYFEYTTLAALLLFQDANLDAVILEVGLGGRLDAVNVIDADCAIVTSVDIDHTDYLGQTREQIGAEKAHIFRAGRPAICADPMAPASLVAHARAIGADLWLFGKDFNYSGDRQQWAYGGRHQRRAGLAYPALRGVNQLLNASAALAALEALRARLAVPAQAIRIGLAQVELPARLQVIPGTPPVILDVAHNVQAAAVLGQNLASMPLSGATHAVIGMLRDKDAAGVIAQLAGHVDHWYCAGLAGARGLDGAALADVVRDVLRHGQAGALTAALVATGGRAAPRVAPRAVAPRGRAPATVAAYPEPLAALAAAREAAGGNDRILVFGSFHTVAPVLQWLARTESH